MPPPVTALLGLSGSAMAAGSLFCATFMTVPGFLAHPDQSIENHIQAFTVFYENGKALMPPTALVSSILLGVSAYNTAGTTASQLYTLASISTVSIIPYTLLVMMNTNNAIMAKTSASDKRSTNDLKKLIKHWGNLNLGRAFLLLVGAAASGTAILELL